MEFKKLLKLRRDLKKKKPEFLRQDYRLRRRLKRKWVKPRGHHSKIKSKLKGRGKPVSTGYRSPSMVRGLDRSGLKALYVGCSKDLAKLNRETEGAVILKSVGMKKRYEIVIKSKELAVKILNMKDIEGFIQKVESSLKVRKEKKKKASDEKAKKKEDKKPKKEEKLTDKISAEDKKKEEKFEKDKILTKKE